MMISTWQKCAFSKVFAFLLIIFVILEHFTEGYPSSDEDKKKTILGDEPPTTVTKSSSKKIVQNSNFLDLSYDCLQEFLNFLPLDDLLSIGETCKELNELAVEYYRKNIQFDIIVYAKHHGIYKSMSNPFTINHFSQFFRRIVISEDGSQIFESKQFNSPYEIEFHNGTFIPTKNFTNILLNLKTFKIHNVHVDDLHATFLRYIRNLNHLYVKDSCYASNYWLSNLYPTLDHFEFISNQENRRVIQFLSKNRIRHFATTVTFLKKNILSFPMYRISNFKVLSIFHAENSLGKGEFSYFLNDLAQFRAHESLFRDLHLYFDFLNFDSVFDYSQILGHTVRLLHIEYVTKYRLSGLGRLQSLYLRDLSQIYDVNNILTQLSQLNYLRCKYATIDQLLLMLRSLPNLKKLQIYELRGGEYLDGRSKILNLSQINEERKLAGNGVYLQIYLSDEIYLATVHKLKQVKLSKIELKRYDSYSPSLDFCYK